MAICNTYSVKPIAFKTISYDLHVVKHLGLHGVRKRIIAILLFNIAVSVTLNPHFSPSVIFYSHRDIPLFFFSF